MAAPAHELPSFVPPPEATQRLPLPPHVIARLRVQQNTAAEMPYDRDIDAYLRSMERAPGRLPAPDYIYKKRHDPLTPPARAALVAWLAMAARRFELHSRTLHLAVSCLDRFLSATAVGSVRVLIPVASAALFVAAKYDEVHAPRANDLTAETCLVLPGNDADGFTKRSLLVAERAVLMVLEHDLGAPTAHAFLELFLERLRGKHRRCRGRSDIDDYSAFLASYLAELSLLDYGMLRFRPSVVAASAVLVARLTVRPCQRPWGRALGAATGYTAAELKDCAQALHRLYQDSIEDASSIGCVLINNKCSQAEFNRVSTLRPNNLNAIRLKYLGQP